MDTEKIRALLKALETGNLGEAADRLGYTHSGMSRMMASLEEETGVRLLNRSRRGVSPTTECEELLPAMRGLVQTDEQYRQIAANLKGLQTGTVRIGNAFYFMQNVLAKTAKEFSGRYPGIKIELIDAYSSELAEMLERGNLDICIISRRDVECDWRPLVDDVMVAWLPEDYKLNRKTYPAEKFAEDDFIEILGEGELDNMKALHSLGIEPNIKYSVRTDQSAYAMVAAGLGVTLTNGIYAKYVTSGIRNVRMDPPCHVEIGIAATPKQLRSLAADKFLEEIYPVCLAEARK